MAWNVCTLSLWCLMDGVLFQGCATTCQRRMNAATGSRQQHTMTYGDGMTKWRAWWRMTVISMRQHYRVLAPAFTPVLTHPSCTYGWRWRMRSHHRYCVCAKFDVSCVIIRRVHVTYVLTASKIFIISHPTRNGIHWVIRSQPQHYSNYL